MLTQQNLCCLCRRPFNQNSQPRMIPHCHHSACTPCLKQYINNQLPKLTCLLCGQEEILNDHDLQYFPKNIILNKQIKEKTFAFSWNKKQDGDTEQSQSSQNDGLFCSIHKKQLEIICMSDRTRVCPHCALFGPHRQHQLKTVKQVNQLIQQKTDQFESIRSRKALLDKNMTCPEFKTQLVQQLTTHKNHLLATIKQKYFQLLQNIKLAEKNAYEDVAKRFKSINEKITQMLRSQHDSQKQYKNWEIKVRELMEKGDKCRKVQDKAYYYFGGNINISKEGEKVLEQIEKNIMSKKKKIEGTISQIRIVQDSAVPNSIFNYLNIVIEDNIVDKTSISSTPHQQSPARIKIEPGNNILDFSSENILKEPESPLRPPKRSCVSSQKSRSKDATLMKRKSVKNDEPTVDVEEIVTEFCEKNTDTLDLTGQALCDFEVIQILKFVKTVKKIKGLKLVRNRLTNQGLSKILDLIPCVTNLNLSFNLLTDDSISLLLSNYSKVPQLRIINLSNNKLNERRSKNITDHLKRQGLIVTL